MSSDVFTSRVANDELSAMPGPGVSENPDDPWETQEQPIAAMSGVVWGDNADSVILQIANAGRYHNGRPLVCGCRLRREVEETDVRCR